MCTNARRPRTKSGTATIPLKAFENLAAAVPNAALETYRETYSSAVADIRALLTTTAPYVRPTQSRQVHPFTQRDMPEVRRDKFNDGEILSKDDFAARARARVSPFAELEKTASAALDEDLRIAIDYVHQRGKRIQGDRKRRLDQLRQIARSIEPLRRALDAHKCTTAQQIASSFNIAWTAAIIDAMQWPDTELPVGYLNGFDVVFNIPDSGVFRAEVQPEQIPKQEFMEANTRAVADLSLIHI